MIRKKDGTIKLSFREASRLNGCPNCGSKEVYLTYKEIGNPDVRRLLGVRVIVKCVKCGYWRDLFDGHRWHPPSPPP